MKSAPCAPSISARNATRPTAMRQYRLRYQVVLAPSRVEGSDIGCLVARTPHGEDHFRLRRILFDLLPQPLDQRVHAADGDKRLVLPDTGQKRLAAEDDAGAGE